eukprot:gene662-664_t
MDRPVNIDSNIKKIRTLGINLPLSTSYLNLCRVFLWGLALSTSGQTFATYPEPITKGALSSSFKNQVESEGLVIKTGTPEDFAQFEKTEELRWRTVIKDVQRITEGTEMSFSLIDLKVQDGIATLFLNRPEKRNAMNDDMRSEFIDALEMITANKDIRALVLTGHGKGFCAGGDISGMEKRMKAPTGEIGFNGWHRQQLNGSASGLGADTALACDFIIASEAANFTWSYINRGIIPDGGGIKVAFDEACRLGLVDRVTSAETLVADAQAWAAELSKGSSTALALGKTILNQTFETTSAQVFAQGSQAQGICYTSAEHRAAVMAFLDKAAAANQA